jgi:nitroreductase
MTTFEMFGELARSRRTSLLMDQERPVDAHLVDELCELASWAPSHKRTWPWRFACFTGNGRARLGSTMADDMDDADFGDEVKRDKTRSKYLRAPNVLVVGCEPHPNEMLHQENRDAVAAAIQNLLLGATALGLASFWSTPALARPPKVLDLCGFDAEDRLVGVIYLGWPAGECPTPERARVDVLRISD